LKSVFNNVVAYTQFVDSFLGEWGWNLAVTAPDAVAPSSLTAQDVDALIAERIHGELKFLDGEAWAGLWALSKKHRQTLEDETRVISAPLPSLLGQSQRLEKDKASVGADIVAKPEIQRSANSVFTTLKDGTKCEAFPLRDDPSYARQLALPLFEEFPTAWKGEGYGDPVAVLSLLEGECCNAEGRPPFVWVCVKSSDGTLLGSVTLDDEDMPSRTDLTPWLMILVVPEARSLGVGRFLMDVMLKSDVAHKNPRVYLWTEKEEGYFTKCGFKRLEPERLEYAGAEVTLMYIDVQ
jgi:GNAT superfamily N-acetyltransferase